MQKAIKWARDFLPALQGARIISVTSFWLVKPDGPRVTSRTKFLFRDGVTETQDPIIAKHPQYQNLTCAAGGSFNRAKDLPTIGNIVAKVLSDQPVSDRYSWKPETKYSHRDHSHLVGRGDFATMEKEAQTEGKYVETNRLPLAVI